MLKHNLFFIINFLIFSVLSATAKRNYRLEIETFTCKNNAPLLIGDVSCITRRDQNDNTTKASVFLYLKQELNYLEVQYTLMISRNSAPLKKILDTRVNVCKFLKTQQKLKLFQYFLDKLKTVTNVEMECPFKAPFNYTLTDYYLDVNKLPPTIPFKRYRVSYLFYYQKRMILNILAMGGLHNV